jgi:hypothetical protein
MACLTIVSLNPRSQAGEIGVQSVPFFDVKKEIRVGVSLSPR